MNQIKIMTIFGTRPEAIKMAPLVKAIESDERFESIVVVTAQHREMLDQVLEIFQVFPDYDLNIMTNDQTLSSITNKVISDLDGVISEAKPDIILVHGDTTTTFAASISAYYHQIKIGHVEAGLRTWNKYSPFPEEMNRQLTDVLSDFYFAPTQQSKNNLLSENHDEDKIYITGNTAIDAMKYTIRDDYDNELLNELEGKRLVLVTMHRRENLGVPMENVFHAINRLVQEFDDIAIIFPMHKNPKVRDTALRILGDSDRVKLIEPLDVIDFHNVSNRSYLILSDSGGVQEQAPSLGVPVLVLRDTTERPEGVEAGTLRLVGTDEENVYLSAKELLTDFGKYSKMSNTSNPYGDGEACRRILESIAFDFSLTDDKPDEFLI